MLLAFVGSLVGWAWYQPPLHRTGSSHQERNDASAWHCRYEPMEKAVTGAAGSSPSSTRIHRPRTARHRGEAIIRAARSGASTSAVPGWFVRAGTLREVPAGNRDQDGWHGSAPSLWKASTATPTVRLWQNTEP
ncbi:hypothetical protein DSL92_08650 [Billgrantia gudaonensis]|uniref:Uncharacterized protein n=1 Tax=Billgrantia gudaonensis TaxID=376427 RepID=A0A3S0NGW9_9GAMM|nr:hypothetical protein DSL92_08650 [Halomonas gudaonensis]